MSFAERRKRYRQMPAFAGGNPIRRPSRSFHPAFVNAL